VSPRKSPRKSRCFSNTTVSTPARSRRYPNIMPAGPPPAMQHRVLRILAIEVTDHRPASISIHAKSVARTYAIYRRRMSVRGNSISIRRRAAVLHHLPLCYLPQSQCGGDRCVAHAGPCTVPISRGLAEVLSVFPGCDAALLRTLRQPAHIRKCVQPEYHRRHHRFLG
jgi:hypothetical protein